MSVVVERDNMERYYEIKEILEDFSAKIGREIHAANAHSRHKAPTTYSDAIEIYFWSAYSVIKGNSTFPSVFGYELEPGQSDCVVVEPGTEENLRNLEDAGNIVAQAVGGTLYITFDLPHTSGEYNICPTIRPILERILEWFIGDKLWETEKETDEPGRVETAVAETMVEFWGRKQREAEKAIDNSEREIIYHQKQIFESMVAVRENRATIDYCRSAIADSKNRASKILKTIKRMAGVKRVTTQRGYLRILTEPIIITSASGVQYLIGEFEIVFLPKSVKVRNLTHMVGNRDHPHVSNHTVCYGATNIQQYIVDGEIDLAVMGILSILNTYNNGDAYAPLDAWPVYTPEPAPVPAPTEGGGQ